MYDIRSGGWYEPELDLMPFAVEPGETVLDIGANFGLWSYHLSRHVGPNGRVLAFEPIPSTYAILLWVRRLFRLRNVDPIQLGCSNRSDRVQFSVPLQGSGGIDAGLAHIGGRTEHSEPNAISYGSLHVWCDVVALDEYLSETQEVTFIKCDIEGAEVLALRGAEMLVDRYRPTVVCEISEDFVKGFGFEVQHLTDFLARYGYHQYHYDRGRLPPLWEVAPDSEVTWHNYAFIHPSRMGRFVSLLG